MHLGILTHNLQYSTLERFISLGEQRGHQVQAIHLNGCFMNLAATTSEVLYHNAGPLPKFAAIIPRFNAANTFYGTAVLRQFELMQSFCVNGSLAITWARDKIRALQILTKKKLPLPTTGCANSPEESEKLINMVGGAPLIIKLLAGTQGRAVVHAETTPAAVSIINAFKQLKTNILVQECIQEAEGSDLRVYIVGKKIIEAFIRTEHKFTPVILTAKERKMALKAASALKLNLATVDLIRAKRGPLILDVECAPNFEKLQKATQVDLITPIFEFIEKTS